MRFTANLAQTFSVTVVLGGVCESFGVRFFSETVSLSTCTFVCRSVSSGGAQAKRTDLEVAAHVPGRLRGADLEQALVGLRALPAVHRHHRVRAEVVAGLPGSGAVLLERGGAQAGGGGGAARAALTLNAGSVLTISEPTSLKSLRLLLERSASSLDLRASSSSSPSCRGSAFRSAPTFRGSEAPLTGKELVTERKRNVRKLASRRGRRQGVARN